MEEKYLYFRTQSSVTGDDGVDDSVCYPLSSFLGMRPGQDDATDDDQIVSLFFRPLRNSAGGSAGDDVDLSLNDVVEIKSVASNSTLKEIMEDLIERFTSYSDGLLIVCDDQTGEKCSSLIASVESITVRNTLT